MRARSRLRMKLMSLRPMKRCWKFSMGVGVLRGTVRLLLQVKQTWWSYWKCDAKKCLDTYNLAELPRWPTVRPIGNLARWSSDWPCTLAPRRWWWQCSSAGSSTVLGDKIVPKLGAFEKKCRLKMRSNLSWGKVGFNPWVLPRLHRPCLRWTSRHRGTTASGQSRLLRVIHLKQTQYTNRNWQVLLILV